MSNISVSTLSLEQLSQVKPLIEKSRQKPYRFLLNDLQDGPIDSFWLSEIAGLSREERGEVFIAAKEGETVGIAAYSDLPWDTKVTGNRMGALKHVIVEQDSPQQQEIIEQLVNQIMDWAISQGIEFLLCRTYADDMATFHALEKKGFLLMDTLLDCIYDLQRDPLCSVPHPPLFEGVTIRLAGDDDVEELMNVAQAAFRNHFGRFHSDQRISKHQATQVYEEWMKSSCEGYADWILVAEINGRIAGFSVWRKPSPIEQSFGIRLGHYSIGAVHPDYQARGLFGALTYAGMELFDGIADYIEGPVHVINYPVQWAYTKLLWRISDARYSFHKWLIG
jgi:GNAT superfamily N-acetyltransferase